MAADSKNFFAFFNIPVAFTIDEKLLKEKYYENTRRFHPDQYGLEEEEKQAEMLELTSLNNAAYKTLKNFERRVQYILNLYGLVNEGEKNTLQPDFLMEMMDINEAIMELKFDADAEKLKQTQEQVQQWDDEINTKLQQLGHTYDTASEADKPTLLQQIKDFYYKRKYILRLKESFSTFAAL